MNPNAIPIEYDIITSRILTAVRRECLALATTQPNEFGVNNAGEFTGTVIFETNYKSEKLQTYTMPLLILALEDEIDSGPFLGGATKMDGSFSMNSYNYDPNSYGDDDSGQSEELSGIIDIIRQHFSVRQWIIPSRGLDTTIPMSMDDIQENYGFKFTLSGVHRARKLDQDGLIIGYRIIFDFIAIDDTTDSVVSSSPEVLESVSQVGSTEVNEEPVGYVQAINIAITMPNTQQDIPGNTLVNSISLFPVTGSPIVEIGTTEGGNDIMQATEISAFKKVEVDQYFPEDSILYFTMTGDGFINTRMDLQRNFFTPLQP